MSRHGTLRASDADRDRIVERLHKASTEGRIAAEELEERVSKALKARTYAELQGLVADLPRPRSGGHVTRRRPTAGWALGTVRAHPALILLVIPLLAVTTALVLAATVVWVVVVAIVLLLGGRRPPAWGGLVGRRGLAPRHRGAGRHWA